MCDLQFVAALLALPANRSFQPTAFGGG